MQRHDPGRSRAGYDEEPRVVAGVDVPEPPVLEDRDEGRDEAGGRERGPEALGKLRGQNVQTVRVDRKEEP